MKEYSICLWTSQSFSSADAIILSTSFICQPEADQSLTEPSDLGVSGSPNAARSNFDAFGVRSQSFLLALKNVAQS